VDTGTADNYLLVNFGGPASGGGNLVVKRRTVAATDRTRLCNVRSGDTLENGT